MDGYDLSIVSLLSVKPRKLTPQIGSFYGQTQFKQRFGDIGAGADKSISAKWQSGLSNSSLCGQILGLAINSLYGQDRFGNRRTMLFFLCWMIVGIFIHVFGENTSCCTIVLIHSANSLGLLAFGELFCGIAWGTFQTLTTSYASEVVPTVLRPYVTAWVCMMWGLGILISGIVLRCVTTVEGELG